MTPSQRRRSATALVVGALAAALAAPAGPARAQDDWGAARTLTTGGWSPALAVAADGRRAWTAWSADSGATAGTRAAGWNGAAWTPARRLGPDGADPGEVTLRVTADGRVGVAAWEQAGVVWLARWRAGAWGTAVAVSDPDAVAGDPAVAVGAAGTGVVAWPTVAADGAAGVASVLVDDSGRRTAPVLSTAGPVRTVAVTVAAGVPTLAWSDPVGAGQRIRVARWQGVAWSPGTAVSGLTTAARDLHLESGGGLAVASWTQVLGGTPQVRVATGTPAGWSAPRTPVTGRSSGAVPAVAPGGSRAVVVFDQIRGDTHRPVARLWQQGVWQRPVALDRRTETAPVAHVTLAADPARGLAAWLAWDGRNEVVRSATLGPDGWSTARTLSAAGLDAGAPQVGLASSGLRGMAMWSRFGQVQSRSLTLVPDRIRGLGVRVRKRQVTVSWAPDALATRYRVTVDGRRRTVVGTRFTTRLSPGRHRVSVRAEGATGTGAQRSARFRVRPPR